MRDPYDVDGLITKIGDPILRSRASEVRDFGESLKALLGDMLEVAMIAGAAGLAAPQIGVLRRAVVVLEDGGTHCLVNPMILETSEESDIEPERCLSLPNITLMVERPVAVTIEASDLEGKRDVIELKGYGARVAQHELDHLDGKLIIDRVDRTERGAAMAALRYGRTYPPVAAAEPDAQA